MGVAREGWRVRPDTRLLPSPSTIDDRGARGDPREARGRGASAERIIVPVTSRSCYVTEKGISKSGVTHGVIPFPKKRDITRIHDL